MTRSTSRNRDRALRKVALTTGGLTALALAATGLTTGLAAEATAGEKSEVTTVTELSDSGSASGEDSDGNDDDGSSNNGSDDNDGSDDDEANEDEEQAREGSTEKVPVTRRTAVRTKPGSDTTRKLPRCDPGDDAQPVADPPRTKPKPKPKPRVTRTAEPDPAPAPPAPKPKPEAPKPKPTKTSSS